MCNGKGKRTCFVAGGDAITTCAVCPSAVVRSTLATDMSTVNADRSGFETKFKAALATLLGVKASRFDILGVKVRAPPL